jgi:hypothetical protein
MRMLSRLSTYSVDGTDDRAPNPFERCIHHIQRLGRVYLTAAMMFSYGQRLPELRNNYRVETIATPPEASLPPLDISTNLESIAVRMHPADSPHLNRRQQALRELNASTQLFEHFQTNYTSQELKPHVHPEIQVLEWFHTGKRLFAADDPFIACSKPSCICCLLYFRYHHGHFVEPISDGKICLSWRPHDLDAENEHPMSEKQQKILMNTMIKEIRKDALHRIDEGSVLKTQHPKASTNMTEYDNLRQAQKCSVRGGSCTLSPGARPDSFSKKFRSVGISMIPATCSGTILSRSTADIGVASSGTCHDQRKMSYGQTLSDIDYIVDDSDEEGGILL